ncbi:two-component response regulator ARR22 isoform X2 [Brassica rapa]|uniref:two-component response regulator ARR22 isoform X2 n=1 Tax=Brassica campestris TaxID=3711 RepID=UPI00142D8E83|nr:two-component response regulator ARR22 isoform X2 [Brassica rapa]
MFMTFIYFSRILFTQLYGTEVWHVTYLQMFCCCSSKSKEEEEEVPAGQVVKKTFKKLCVLVVDDDRSCRSLYMGFIQMRGGFPYMAENGEEAVNLYRDGQTFNLILMDNEMPVMDGVSATKDRGIDVT